MKYLGAAVFSIAVLIAWICREEGVLRMRKWLHNEDPKEHRKKEYKGLIIAWVIITIAVFIYVAFFWELH
jgi:hypothetical protein